MAENVKRYSIPGIEGEFRFAGEFSRWQPVDPRRWQPFFSGILVVGQKKKRNFPIQCK